MNSTTVALEVQAGALRVTRGDFCFRAGAGNTDFKTALCFGNGDFWRNIVFSHD